MEGISLQSGFEIPNIKLQTWNNTRSNVENYADANGLGIDEGIKEAVTSFNVNGLPTNQSCEGHDFSFGSGLHMPLPWIGVGAHNEPQERFMGESALFEEVAQKENVELEDLRRGRLEDLYNNVRKELNKREETLEYKKWVEQNKKLFQKAQKLVEEFYQNRKADPDIEIVIEDETAGFVVRSRDERLLKHLDGELSEEDKKDLMSLLPLRQKEMTDFANFLKMKYFETN